jgi:hypothetical protein
MKAKLCLLLFGSILGALPIVVYFVIFGVSNGSSYASVRELHEAMLERDDRDVQGDRSVSLRSIIVPHPSKEIIYDLLPHLDVRFQGARVTTNSCGMRGPERSHAKDPNVFRIALLGDSFAFGWGVEYDESFAHVLERELNRVIPEPRRVEVLNFGVPGYSTFQEVARFMELGIDFNVDAVLVYFIENDFGLPFFLGSGERGALMSAVDFARNVWNPNRDEDRDERRQLQQLLDPNRALTRLDEELRAHGIPLFVAVNPGKGWEDTVRRLRALNRRPGITFLDLRTRMVQMIRDQQIPEASLRLPTDPHPSPLKHRLLGELLAEHLSPIVRD